MSKVRQINTQDACYAEASLWLSRIDRGLTAREHEELQLWLDQDPENLSTFLKLAKLWDKVDVLSRLSDLFPEDQPKTKTAWYGPALAATVMMLALLGVWQFTLLNSSVEDAPAVANSEPKNVYETAVGEHSKVRLSDGSELVLNTNSRIQVMFSKKRRLLKLERGEVHIQVAHDTARPLMVMAGDQLVQAVGTAFNIELNSEQKVELMVTEGKVLVGVHTPQTLKPGLEPEVLQASEAVAVSQGELLLSDNRETVKKIKTDEINVKLSWQKGNLIFRGESLSDAVAEVSRYTPVEFVFLDEDLKKIRVAGLFKAGDVEGLLATLQKNFNISYQMQDQQVLLGGKL